MSRPPPEPAVGYCPFCGADLTAGRPFVQEFWSGADRNFVCWCAACGLMSTVALATRLVAVEAEH